MEYRAVLPGEIPAAVDVFIEGLADLARRYGLRPVALDREGRIPEFEHTRRTGIFRVAVEGGRVVAICSAQVRGDVWFLSKFFTVPEFQGRGIGKPLLEQVWQEGVRRGAERFFVWSTMDYTALAMYMRLGMLPGCQLLRFAGQPRRRPSAEVDAVPLTVEAAAAIDRQVRSAGREIDHDFLLHQQGQRGWLIRGRAYVYEQVSWIGRAAWLEPELGPEVLAFALGKTEGEVRMTIPGMNHQAIRFALEIGLRLDGMSHLLMTAPIGQFDRYLPLSAELF